MIELNIKINSFVSEVADTESNNSVTTCKGGVLFELSV